MEVGKTFVGHVNPYENSVVLCSCCRICVWSCREGNDRVNPVLVTCIIICSNVGICCFLLTCVKRHHWREWFSAQERMRNYWGVEAALQICLRFTFLVKSLGVALCWNSKDYWCLKDVPARSFLAVGKTLLIITILIWCLPRIRVFLLYSASMQRHFTADWWLREDSCYPTYYTWSSPYVSVYQSTGDCRYFSVLNLISHYHPLICIYTLVFISETKKLLTAIKEI
jgi:hypothetical protein